MTAGWEKTGWTEGLHSYKGLGSKVLPLRRLGVVTGNVLSVTGNVLRSRGEASPEPGRAAPARRNSWVANLEGPRQSP